MPLSRAAVSFFVIFLPFLWLIEGKFKKKWTYIKSNKALLGLLIFISLLFCSILWTSNFDDAKRPLRLLSYFFTTIVIATSLKKEHIQPTITAFLSGMFVSELIAYGVYFELWQFKNATPQNPSPFMFHIDYSVFLAFTSLLLLNRLLSKRYTLTQKIFIFFFFLTVTGNLFIGIGRTGQLAMIVGILSMFLYHFKLSFKSLTIAVLSIIITLFIAYNVSPNFQKRLHQAYSDITQISKAHFHSSWGIRAAYWITTFHIVKEHPLLGVGIGDYMKATEKELQKPQYNPKRYAKHFMATNTPHNQYLLILLQVGLIGLGVFLYIFYNLLKLPISDPEIKEISIVFTTVFAVSFLADTLLMQQFALVLFVFFIGIFTAKDIQNT